MLYTSFYFCVYFPHVDTFGVQSVHLNDTDEDSVSCKCFFYSFSSDKGCEVLLLSDTQKYEKTFTRSGEIATGSIFDIETGLYHVDVFDQDNSEVVITTTIKVIQESSIPISYITSISISATVTTLAMLSTTKCKFISEPFMVIFAVKIHRYFNV